MATLPERSFIFLKRYKIWIIAFWLITSIFCSFFALGLLDATIWILDPPKGYPSYDAYNKMNEYFPALLNADAEIIVIELKNNVNMKNIDNNITEKLCDDINYRLYELDDSIMASTQYYYLYKEENISSIALNRVIKPKFIDSSSNLMVFIINLNVAGVSTKRVNSFIDATKSILTDLKDSNIEYSAYYKLELTGMMTLIEDTIHVLTADIISKDLYMVPVIFIFMIFVIGSYKLVIIPFLCFAMVVSISFAIFRIIAEKEWMTIPPENPSFMLFISMAICIDYGMFLLTRFINGIEYNSDHHDDDDDDDDNNKFNTDDAIKDMLTYSGHVIVLSGCILILLEIGFALFFPDGGLNAAGYGIAFCVALSIIISISFTTSIILLFPNYFSDIQRVPKWLKSICCFCCNHYEYKKEEYVSLQQQEYIEKHETTNNRDISSIFSINASPNTVKTDNNNKLKEEQQQQQEKENIYFKFAQIATKWPYKLLFPLIIYLSMIPVLYQLLSWTTTMSPNMMFPTNTDSVNAYNKLINNFNPGLMQPFYVLSLPLNDQQNTIWDDKYLSNICNFGDSLISNGYTNNSDMMSFVFLPNPLKPQRIECFKNESVVHSIKNTLYLQLFNMTVNGDENASLIILYPTFNPFGNLAQSNSKKWRDFIHSYNSNNSMNLYVHSEVFWQIDLLQMEYDRLPLCLIIMLSLIFIIIGFVFKSIFLPFQLLFCIVIPIMFVYGCCVGVYSKGWLNWLNIIGLYESNGLFWPTPILSLSLLLGLALDYEIFLLSRVYEYRSKYKYTNRASIILALSTTGPIISSAGIVMSLAFGGLLLETVISCDQFGFIFVIGVIIDTFIVRPILVPTILSFSDYLNWYPTIMPSENLKNEYHQIVDAK